MEVILSYLDNMFLNMPKTKEVLRAKEELALMMEDKYNELLAEGKKENEAIGIVISEFGDLEELARELGLEGIQNESRKKDINIDDTKKKSVRTVSRKEAEEYITFSEQFSKWIAIGVMLCIYSPICLLLCAAVDDGIVALSDAQFVCFGLVPLFILIGAAVAIFIYYGMKMEKFEYLKKEIFQIEESLDRELTRMEEQEKPGATIKIIVGVVLCIFSVIPILITGSSATKDMYNVFSVILLLIMVGIAVAFFIIGGIRLDCIKILRQEGEYTKTKKKIVDTVGGVYWPIVTAVYLIWSFITMGWGYTWIIWPIAGIIFGAIAVICEMIQKGIGIEV